MMVSGAVGEKSAIIIPLLLCYCYFYTPCYRCIGWLHTSTGRNVLTHCHLVLVV